MLVRSRVAQKRQTLVRRLVEGRTSVSVSASVWCRRAPTGACLSASRAATLSDGALGPALSLEETLGLPGRWMGGSEAPRDHCGARSTFG